MKTGEARPEVRQEKEQKRHDFIYVSDGLPHKNHRRLFAVWRLLADLGVRPSLAFTLHPGRDAALRDEVRALAANGLLIEDLGTIPHPELLELYRQVGSVGLSELRRIVWQSPFRRERRRPAYSGTRA